ncbi:hypothetical protein BofuT4_uP028650.1 [Botrytis cinerea T4]|uniref:Uncharacterized protein n=1 Tax=Botryotinia fuckeliana (strain T4) TaxID=999810 RepID=G2Y8R3_BOTF4|nr:hypothetical protein BofuT4_uP028650.1 [Botrytis cinerea T4]
MSFEPFGRSSNAEAQGLGKEGSTVSSSNHANLCKPVSRENGPIDTTCAYSPDENLAVSRLGGS